MVLARASNGDCRRVGCSGGKISLVDSIAVRHSFLDGLDVYGVGAGKQRRKIKKRVGWFVGVIKPTPTVVEYLPRVSNAEVLAAANAAVSGCSVRSAKNPKRFCWVVLAWVDMDVKLRLGGGCRPNQSHSRQAESCPLLPFPLNPHLSATIFRRFLGFVKNFFAQKFPFLVRFLSFIILHYLAYLDSQQIQTFSQHGAGLFQQEKS